MNEGYSVKIGLDESLSSDEAERLMRENSHDQLVQGALALGRENATLRERVRELEAEILSREEGSRRESEHE